MAEDKFYSKFQKKSSDKTEKTEKKSGTQKSVGSSDRVKASDIKNSGKTTFNKKTNDKNIDLKKSGSLVEREIKTEKNIYPSLFSTHSIPKESLNIINNYDEIIQGVRPLNSKQLQQLPDNIKAFSHQLTDERSTRRLGYMNETVQLSSYVRYYTWWNLVRLVRLFSNLPDSLFPKEDSVCLDLGSGPLTVVIALWLARPELREKKLTWYCLDVSSNSLALGEDLYLSVAAKTNCEPWKIIRVKGSFGTNIKQKCDFITCANMLNELDQASHMPPEYQTKKYFEQLTNYGTKEANFLLVEPGVPKAARTLSLLRDRFIGIEKYVLAPCPHAEECPMNGFKAYTGSQHKWCNFSFSTVDAPAKLLKLSEQAKLSKDRATLAFIAISTKPASKNKTDDEMKIRINSDPFPLPAGRTGFYGCSKLGLTLISTRNKQLTSGDLISVKKPREGKIDQKSGARIVEL